MRDTVFHAIERLKIMEQLKKREISVIDVPDEYKNDTQLIKFERKIGLRITEKRGFDVISNSFFVEETLVYENRAGEECHKPVRIHFDGFNSYYAFLSGDIYTNACYAFYSPSSEILSAFKINTKKFWSKSAFVENTIDDFTLLTSDDIVKYNEAEEIRQKCQQWIFKFNKCNSYRELLRVTRQYEKSPLSSVVDITFFFFNFIFADVSDSERFSIIMEYMSSGMYPERKMINALCSIYDPDAVLQAYKYSAGSSSTISRHKRNLKEYIQNLKAGNVGFITTSYFDPKTHYYVIKVTSFYKDNKQLYIPPMLRYFETFEEFVTCCNGDLSNCDLSSALKLNVDFSQYITNNSTIFPLSNNQNSTYSIKKGYRNGKFFVQQQWSNTNGKTIKEYTHTFDYFFDFVSFLKRDLSNANLILCDGLTHLQNAFSINFSAAKIPSTVCEQLGQSYQAYRVNTSLIGSFKLTEQNEIETGLVLQNAEHSLEKIDGSLLSDDELPENNYQVICYISDIHLMHKIQAANCHSKEDVLSVIQQVVNSISHECNGTLLIGGDVASDFEIFSEFVNHLADALPRSTIIFTLGNHEIWSFPGLKIEQIVEKYRNLLDEHGMYLLYNDLFYEDDNEIHLIQYAKLCVENATSLVEKLRNARYIIWGGLGYAGYNENFNANNDIYRQTIDRDTEIQETLKFEALYNNLAPILSKKNTIVLTHNPKKDWCKEKEPQKGFIYISGHTHRNVFYDDGDYRIYADNQIGYHNNNIHLKYLLVNTDYDCFDDYPDGIHEITREQYCNFYRGKNIEMTFHRKNKLYMLKKSGHYCFLCDSGTNQLSILNGGAMKKLDNNNVQYYYDNMDKMINIIMKPLNKFTSIQESISIKYCFIFSRIRVSRTEMFFSESPINSAMSL